jgi:phospholipid N-methyltransferase
LPERNLSKAKSKQQVMHRTAQWPRTSATLMLCPTRTVDDLMAPQIVSSPKPKRHSLAFFREFLRSPKQIGACFTCTPHVARALLRDIGLEKATSFAELGAGTGAVTEVIRQYLPPGCNFFAVELSPNLADVLRQNVPGVKVIVDDAANIKQHCRQLGINQLDGVVSVLPLMLFSRELQNKVCGAVASALKPGAYMTQVTYHADGLPTAKALRRMLENHFTTVEPTRMVWRNIPPVFIYRCVR